jgi:excisionase family DNA binding protein
MVTLYQLQDELKKFKCEMIQEMIDALSNLNKKRRELEFSEYMSVEETAGYFGKSRVTINKWVKNGYINSIKKGNQRLFMRSEMENFKNNKFENYERLQQNKFR